MNSTVLGLGAGGSRVELIPLVNRVTALGMAVAAVAAVFGGTCTNKLGPRATLLIATSGYPLFVVCLWYAFSPVLDRILTWSRLIDNNLAKWFAWIATIWHGVSAAFLYSAVGYVLTAYSPERSRGRYVASMWASQLLGNVIGSCKSLG
jgi:MFS family permease